MYVAKMFQFCFISFFFCTGIAYDTVFIIGCTGWLDEGYREDINPLVDKQTQVILDYEVFYELQGDKMGICLYVENGAGGEFVSKPHQFRQGYFSHEYKVNVIVTIKDVRQSKTRFVIPIQVCSHYKYF